MLFIIIISIKNLLYIDFQFDSVSEIREIKAVKAEVRREWCGSLLVETNYLILKPVNLCLFLQLYFPLAPYTTSCSPLLLVHLPNTPNT